MESQHLETQEDYCNFEANVNDIASLKPPKKSLLILGFDCRGLGALWAGRAHSREAPCC